MEIYFRNIMSSSLAQKITIRAQENQRHGLSASCFSHKLASLVVLYSLSIWKYSDGILPAMLAHDCSISSDVVGLYDSRRASQDSITF